MKGKNQVVSVSLVALGIFLPLAEVLFINIQPSSATCFESKIETIISNNEKEEEEEEPCNSEGGNIICPP